jgi:hypothetical protein
MAMTATEAHAKLKASGVPDDQVEQLKAAAANMAAFNWQALLQAITQYGPVIVSVILSIFGVSPTPVTPPGPQPAEK